MEKQIPVTNYSQGSDQLKPSFIYKQDLFDFDA